MVSKRYIRPGEKIGVAIKRTRESLQDVQRPTGTEKARTKVVAEQAAVDADFAKELAEQLETELGPLPGQVQEALDDAAQALSEAGLARSEAATAISDAQQAVADATQAINDASAATSAANAAQSTANAAQTAAGNAQDAADSAAADALAASNAASAAQSTANSKGKTIIQSAAPAVADRLPQNLWIDTTGGANTPKRWDGSNWVAVTDKTATDAAAAAVAAQDRADEAFNEAVDAATAAGNAQISADGKARIWYQGTAPSGTGHKVDDVWFNTSQGNRMARWNGSSWAVVEFGGAALANSAVTAIKLADDAVTSAKIATGAVDDNALSPVVKGAITTAQSTADAASTAASNAASAASAAQGTANTAQSNATQALADALAAANAASGAQSTADGKGKVIIQATAPASADRLPQNLWIDTAGGANTPKRWSGSAWVAVTDKVATDAASAAVTAQSAANAAQSQADLAHGIATSAQTAASAAQSAASAAASAAAAAQSTADGKATVVRSTSAATAAGSYKQGDQWWQFSGANVVGFWLHSGSAWVAQALTNTIIANLDAAKITTGYLAAARIEAATITGTHIAGATVTAANMVAGTITAASGIIANAAIGTAQIIDLAVTGAKIANLSVTNAKIADATIQSAKIASLDAGKITTGTLDAARIAALSITTGHLAADSVTTAKIAALAVTAAEIAANAVTAVKIAANAVTAEKINAGAVTTDKLDALAVTAAKIAAGAIIADKIAAGAITTAKLAADAIDGMTITGALIRTAATGNRLEFDSVGLRAYNAGGLTAELKSEGGNLSLKGALSVADFVTETGSGPGYLSGDGLFLQRGINRGLRGYFGNKATGGSVTTLFAGDYPVSSVDMQLNPPDSVNITLQAATRKIFMNGDVTHIDDELSAQNIVIDGYQSGWSPGAQIRWVKHGNLVHLEGQTTADRQLLRITGSLVTLPLPFPALGAALDGGGFFLDVTTGVFYEMKLRLADTSVAAMEVVRADTVSARRVTLNQVGIPSGNFTRWRFSCTYLAQ